MTNEPTLRDSIKYWKSVAGIVSFAARDGAFKEPAEKVRDNLQILVTGIPMPSDAMAKSREFFDVGLQLAETEDDSIQTAVWYILGKSVRKFEDAMRLLSQMNIKSREGSSMPGMAGMLISGVILPLTARFRRELVRPALMLITDFLDNITDVEEKFTLVGAVLALLKYIDPSIRKRKFAPPMFVDLADDLAEDDKYREAEAVAKIGLSFFPHVPDLLVYNTEKTFGENIFDRQPSELERMISLFPDRPEFRRKRAEYYLDREDFARALDDMRAYVQLAPEDNDFRAAYAHALAMNYKPIEALEEYNSLVELEPTVARHFLGRARLYDQLEMSEKALEDYAKALELDPALMEAHIGREQSMMKRQAMGMDDDLYGAYLSGGEEKFVEQKVPTETFADIAGLDQVKEIIRETIKYPLTYPELAEKYGKGAGGGVLFFGPPGCGKTMVARAAAGECGIPFIIVNLSNVLDKWVGNSEKAISMIFRVARKNTPSIIFFDELDSLGMAREDTHTGWEKKIISQLLTEMDGTGSDNKNVLILGATNAPWNVDLALRRAGRFGKSIFVPPPDAAERAAIFSLYIEKKPFVDREGVDAFELARRTELHSSDSIRQIVDDAATIPWKVAIATGESRPIEMKDLLAAIENRQPDLAEWDKLVSRYEEFARQAKAKPSIGFRSGKPRPQGA